MTNVGALAYKVSADAQGFQAGMQLSRSELAMTRRAMTDSRTDAEKLARKIDVLEKAVRSGAITEDEYARAVSHARAKSAEGRAEAAERNAAMAEGRKITESLETATERYARELEDLNGLLRRGAISQETYGRATAKAKADLANSRSDIAAQIPMVGNLSSSLITGAARFGPYGAAAVAIGASLYAFGKAVAFVSDQVSQQMEVIDQQHETASQLMVDLQAFQTLVFAGGKQSGASEDQIGAMLGKLQLNFAKAAQGNEKLRSTIQGLGLDVDQLANKDPAIIFREVSQAVSELKTPGEQMKAVFDLAGKQGVTMLDTFRLGADGIDEMNSRLGELNGLMSETDAEQIALANDAWNEMKMALDNVWNSLAVEFAPAVQTAAMLLEKVIGWGGKFVDFLGIIPDALLLATGLMADFYETAAGVLTLDFDRIASGLNGDQTIGMIKAKEAMVAMQKAEGERIRREKEQRSAQMAAMEAREEMQGASEPTKEDPAADITKEIEALRAKNLELEKGKDFVEALRIAKLDASPELKSELIHQMGITKQLEAQAEFKKEMNRLRGVKEEEGWKAFLSADQKNALQQAQIQRENTDKANQLIESLKSDKSPFEQAIDEIREIRRLYGVGAIDKHTAHQAELAARKRIPQAERKDIPASAPTANQGSRQAYQLIVDNAKAQRDVEDARHREIMAEQAIANALGERIALATERMQPVGGV